MNIFPSSHRLCLLLFQGSVHHNTADFFLSAGNGVQDLLILFLFRTESALFLTDPSFLFPDTTGFLSLGITFLLFLSADLCIFPSAHCILSGQFPDPVTTVSHTV